MGHGHGIEEGSERRGAGRAGRGSGALLLTGLLVPVLIATAVGMALLWPRGPVDEASAAREAYRGVAFARVSVVGVEQARCEGGSGDRQADGSIPVTTVCTTVVGRTVSGPEPGLAVRFGLPPEVVRSGVRAGDSLRVARYPSVDGQPAVYAFLDFDRQLPLGALAAVFAVLVVAVARLRGLLALVSLVVAFAAVGFFILPALRRHENPLLVAGVGATAIMTVILYLTHGLSRRTSTALLGTVAGIWTTAGLAAWVTSAARLTGLTSEENIQLDRFTTFPDLGGLVLAGIILAGLGVLNDVTITQASAVWELHEAAPDIPARRLYSRGMRIGRDHLASTVYTLAFAYVGGALPALLLIGIYGEPLGSWIWHGDIAEEIARTLVASLGLLLAVPLTTLIAVVVTRGTTASSRQIPAARQTGAEATPGEPAPLRRTRHRAR